MIANHDQLASLKKLLIALEEFKNIPQESNACLVESKVADEDKKSVQKVWASLADLNSAIHMIIPPDATPSAARFASVKERLASVVVDAVVSKIEF